MEEKTPVPRNVEVLEGAPGDIEGVMEVMRITWIDTYPNVEAGITREEIETRFNYTEEQRQTRVDFMKRLVSDPKRHLFVAKEKGSVVGYCWVVKEDAYNEVGSLYVLPSYQGRGIGTGLFQRGLDWLGDEKEIKVGVASYNSKAIDFYKKFGFTETGKPLSLQPPVLPSGCFMPEIELSRK